jgi:hypothetical protein
VLFLKGLPQEFTLPRTGMDGSRRSTEEESQIKISILFLLFVIVCNKYMIAPSGAMV